MNGRLRTVGLLATIRITALIAIPVLIAILIAVLVTPTPSILVGVLVLAVILPVLTLSPVRIASLPLRSLVVTWLPPLRVASLCTWLTGLAASLTVSSLFTVTLISAGIAIAMHQTANLIRIFLAKQVAV